MVIVEGILPVSSMRKDNETMSVKSPRPEVCPDIEELEEKRELEILTSNMTEDKLDKYSSPNARVYWLLTVRN